MGCDIHLYKEKHVDGRWVTADKWTPYDYGDDDNGVEVKWEDRFTDRNYQLFGLLSEGVRSEHHFSFKPRGLPFNACPEIAAKAASWDSDGHSHSYLYLHELKDMLAYLQSASITISGMIEEQRLNQLRDTIASGEPNWDLLWPYCQWTNQPGHVQFEQDVPASLYFDKALKEIIASFDGVDGDNHRIVFFFDN